MLFFYSRQLEKHSNTVNNKTIYWEYLYQGLMGVVFIRVNLELIEECTSDYDLIHPEINTYFRNLKKI